MPAVCLLVPDALPSTVPAPAVCSCGCSAPRYPALPAPASIPCCRSGLIAASSTTMQSSACRWVLHGQTATLLQLAAACCSVAPVQHWPPGNMNRPVLAAAVVLSPSTSPLHLLSNTWLSWLSSLPCCLPPRLPPACPLSCLPACSTASCGLPCWRWCCTWCTCSQRPSPSGASSSVGGCGRGP